MKLERIVTIICGILLVCMLLTGLYFRRWYKAVNQINGIQPYMIMVDGIRYSNFGPAPTEKPEGAPLGTVSRVNAPADYPDEDGEANFGTVGMPYWKAPLGICVYYNEAYILLRD